MSKKRIYEYAKDLKLKSKDIIDELAKMDVEVTSHMQTLEDDQIKALDNRKVLKTNNQRRIIKITKVTKAIKIINQTTRKIIKTTIRMLIKTTIRMLIKTIKIINNLNKKSQRKYLLKLRIMMV